MKQNPDIAQQIEDTLNSLEGIQRASPGPYFFTRVMARLDNSARSSWDILAGWLNRPAIALGSILLIIALNIAVMWQDRAEPANDFTQVADQEQAFVAEYNLDIPTIYNYDNTEPR